MNKILRVFIVVSILFLAAGFGRSDNKIFNGKNLDGWQVAPEELSTHWMVKKGKVLYGENPDEKGSMIWTKKIYKDYELELEFKTLSGDYDSGVFPRGDGTQVQIGISRALQKDLTACIYAPRDNNGLYPAQTEKVAEIHKPGEWNHLRIIVQGNRIQTFLNGEAFVDYESSTMNTEGPVGLQLHPGVHMRMEFRKIKLLEL